MCVFVFPLRNSGAFSGGLSSENPRWRRFVQQWCIGKVVDCKEQSRGSTTSSSKKKVKDKQERYFEYKNLNYMYIVLFFFSPEEISMLKLVLPGIIWQQLAKFIVHNKFIQISAKYHQGIYYRYLSCYTVMYHTTT